ncbi:MAG: hypothetical protein JO083_07135 [Candidatus Eremiobacteraeota bacterium]|nr:hypothetical protein [Candidatus Eremiobacteraeota bacterium]MBV8369097.1 hypothetical protein [Candidatus Eremiobacteraeota bacterium]
MEQANLDPAVLKERFRVRLDALLNEVRQWLSADPRVLVTDHRYVVEDPFGRYEAPGLQISAEGRIIAELVPEAGVVIAADGRVNLVGEIDRLTILYLTGPGRFESTINGVQHFGRNLFPQFSQEGWYWLRNNEGPEVRFVDEATFRLMIPAVSDFEVRVRS